VLASAFRFKYLTGCRGENGGKIREILADKDNNLNHLNAQFI